MLSSRSKSSAVPSCHTIPPASSSHTQSDTKTTAPVEGKTTPRIFPPAPLYSLYPSPSSTGHRTLSRKSPSCLHGSSHAGRLQRTCVPAPRANLSKRG